MKLRVYRVNAEGRWVAAGVRVVPSDETTLFGGFASKGLIAWDPRRLTEDDHFANHWEAINLAPTPEGLYFAFPMTSRHCSMLERENPHFSNPAWGIWGEWTLVRRHHDKKLELQLSRQLVPPAMLACKPDVSTLGWVHPPSAPLHAETLVDLLRTHNPTWLACCYSDATRETLARLAATASSSALLEDAAPALSTNNNDSNPAMEDNAVPQDQIMT